jgi:hypothetical protein
MVCIASEKMIWRSCKVARKTTHAKRRRALKAGSSDVTRRVTAWTWVALIKYLAAREDDGCEVKQALQAAGQVLYGLDKVILLSLPLDAPAIDVPVSVKLPSSSREAAAHCLRYSQLVTSCALVAAYFPDGLSTSTFVRLHEEQLNADLPPLAAKDVLRSELSAKARRFIEGRPDEDLRAMAAGIGLLFLSALREATAVGTKLVGHDSRHHGSSPSARIRAGRESALSAEKAVLAAARNAISFIDRLGGLGKIQEPPLAQDVYDSWQFLVRHQFWEHLPAATTEDIERLGDELSRDAAGEGGKLSIEQSAPIPSSEVTHPLVVEAGGFRYKGAFHRLSGKPLKVLKGFVDAHGGAVSLQQLCDAYWNDRQVGNETIYSAVSNARKSVRDAMCAAGDLNRDDDFNPIPSVDRGDALAWKLDLSNEIRKRQ